MLNHIWLYGIFKGEKLDHMTFKFDIQFYGVCHCDLHQIRDDLGGSIFSMVAVHEIVGKVIEVGCHVNKLPVAFELKKCSKELFKQRSAYEITKKKCCCKTTAHQKKTIIII